MSESYEGYLDLVEQFTNPWIREYDDLSVWEDLVDSWIETSFPNLLANPEDSDLYTETEYFHDMIDSVIELYNAKSGNHDDPELAAAVRELSEQVNLFYMLVFLKLGIYLLEDPEEEPTDEEVAAEIMGWLEQSEALSSGFRLPSVAAAGFMAADLVWEDVILTEEDDLWHAEIYFYSEQKQENGYYLLTFTNEKGEWKICQGLLSQ